MLLHIHQPHQGVRTIPLSGGSTFKIGRAVTCDVHIEDSSLSRIHAVIEVSASGALTVIDLGSARGTEVNGSPINRAALKVGDVMRLGEVTIEVGAPGALPHAPAPGSHASPAPPAAPVSRPATAPSGSHAVFIIAIVGMLFVASGVVIMLLL
jgi:predicted component of type VI protein secretion system